MGFDDLQDEELAAASGKAAAIALHAARLQAAERLVAGPAAGVGDASTALEVLLARDVSDKRFELLQAFEKRWALLVIRIIAPISDPAPAIADARQRGVTVAAIAETLQITHQGVYKRYGNIVRKPRK